MRSSGGTKSGLDYRSSPSRNRRLPALPGPHSKRAEFQVEGRLSDSHDVEEAGEDETAQCHRQAAATRIRRAPAGSKKASDGSSMPPVQVDGAGQFVRSTSRWQDARLTQCERAPQGGGARSLESLAQDLGVRHLLELFDDLDRGCQLDGVLEWRERLMQVARLR